MTFCCRDGNKWLKNFCVFSVGIRIIMLDVAQEWDETWNVSVSLYIFSCVGRSRLHLLKIYHLSFFNSSDIRTIRHLLYCFSFNFFLQLFPKDVVSNVHFASSTVEYSLQKEDENIYEKFRWKKSSKRSTIFCKKICTCSVYILTFCILHLSPEPNSLIRRLRQEWQNVNAIVCLQRCTPVCVCLWLWTWTWRCDTWIYMACKASGAKRTTMTHHIVYANALWRCSTFRARLMIVKTSGVILFYER